jgi:hypothetical protein
MTVNHMAIKEISKLLETEIGELLSNPSNHFYFPGVFLFFHTLCMSLRLVSPVICIIGSFLEKLHNAVALIGRAFPLDKNADTGY